MTKRDNNAYEHSLYLLRSCNNEKLMLRALSKILCCLDLRDHESKGLIRAIDLKSGLSIDQEDICDCEVQPCPIHNEKDK